MPLTGWLVLAAIVGLFVGPALSVIWPSGRAWRSALDGFTVTAVGGLCLIVLLPDALARGGAVAGGLALAGAFAPGWLRGHGARDGARGALLVGLCAHAAVEAAALAVADSGHEARLGLAIAMHQVPVGLAVFAWFRDDASRAGWLAVGGVALATLVGFGLGAPVAGFVSGGAVAALEGLVAGMLLHVAWDRQHAEAACAVCRPDASERSVSWQAVGGIVGAAVVGALILGSDPHAGAHAHAHAPGSAAFAGEIGWMALQVGALVASVGWLVFRWTGQGVAEPCCEAS